MPYKDPEKARAAQKAWYEANKEKRKAQIRLYKRANPAKVAAGNAEYKSRPEVRERATLKKRLWRAANLERERKNRRMWARNNRDRIRFYDSKRDRREYNARYYAANVEYYAHKNAMRYIRMRAGDVVTDRQWSELKAVSK